MPIIVDNNFSHDTFAVRAERLNAIQGNFASIQLELLAQSHFVTS